MKQVVLASITNVCWFIWCCRNKARFENQQIHHRLAINWIMASTLLFGNSSSGHGSSAMEEFTFLKAFSISTRPRIAPSIIQVDWLPPLMAGLSATLTALCVDPRVMQVEGESSETVV